jgi:hypothetical protein
MEMKFLGSGGGIYAKLPFVIKKCDIYKPSFTNFLVGNVGEKNAEIAKIENEPRIIDLKNKFDVGSKTIIY